ncbi:MAG: ribonuclease Z [Candidatus Micrarchaeota archaeon]|nr:ribonuclease Z [Candidatus Micrarchaeota archaeon]
MMRLVVLGSGAAVPSPERNLTSIALRYEGDVFLFDCGEGTQRQMMKYKISYSKVRMILISHLHGDHIFGIPGLLYTLSIEENKRKEPLLIAGPKGTEKRIRELVSKDIPFLKIEEIDEGWNIDLGSAVIYAFRTNHSNNGVSLGYVFEEKETLRFDKEKCEKLGIKGKMFKIIESEGYIKLGKKTVKMEEITYKKKGKKIVITGDTAYSENTIKHASGSDILFHEATFMEDMRDKADEDFHSTVMDAATVANKARVKKLVLYHIGNRYKDDKEIEDEAKKIFENTVVAKDGLEIHL